MLKVTVIIPIYNSEKVLRRCIRSVQRQTYRNIEVILVDDGSIDSSGTICDEYASNDDRVKVFHIKNSGVSSARNYGLFHATGEKVLFVDSDDWVDEYYVESLMSVSEDYDLVIGSATLVNKSAAKYDAFPDIAVSSKEFDKLFADQRILKRTSPWAKLFNSKVIKEKQIVFPEGMHIGEDAVFLYSYILYCDRILVVDNRLYYYNVESMGSLTKRMNSVQDEMYALETLSLAIDKLMISKNIREDAAIANLCWLRSTYIHRVLNAIYYHNLPRMQRIQILNNLDIQTYCTHFINSQHTLYYKVIGFILRANLVRSYDCIRRLIKIIKYNQF